MKKRDLAELRKKDQKELGGLVIAKNKERDMFLAKMSVGKESNTKQAKAIKRDIAQIMTILREQQKKK
ncbi:MAG: hypothetical protein UV74_C0013G0518 [Candidatus Woesebacteria bacterium GW2011_GWB1_43_14]|uniref:Large ribosomal subunit protein uL29 n=1 Tax=Candidatus Woesebacteria bacterium GW2011_GWB1_43_14 TaxID=1618578 RepID=A0A0G1FQS9_9BACT|nr:MAG: hypothetical protein UT21_C0001G0231 [Candidatus Woesebacteria bacterium GW2011_GWA1_39_11b]KKS78024.1 MAG: hypothetical protein UV51_C0003G0059 [Candidatus Woesebacteria bacterium GW2011_GWC1_42_9]KKS97396.1 MAG: hypothetical protein UV74_C0013G0518 [Candidatus Woesebacteria bacterium GW2011_GWB1_43_14]